MSLLRDPKLGDHRVTPVELFFDLVEIANAHQDGVRRFDGRLIAANLGQFRGFGPEQRGERHAVHIP